MHPFPVFVINLKRDTERLDFMQRQLEELNIPFEVIPAIDGASIPAQQMGRKQIGCFLSHIKAWRTILERDLPAALILEDDVLLNDDFPEIFRNLRLSDGCQILQLVSVNKLYSVRNRIFSPYGAMSLSNGWKMACSLGESFGTQAYIIRQTLARRLLREESRLRVPVDYALFFWTCNLQLPWVVYKKERRGVYVTLGKEKRDWGREPVRNEQKRLFIAECIKKQFDAPRMPAAADSAREENLPVFLIHLKKDAQRLETMQRKFDAMGLSFETVEAVDGNLISRETMDKIHDGKRARRSLDRELSPAEIGRYLSHIKAYRALLNLDAPAAAIVEDDAVLDGNFPKLIKYSGDRVKRGVFKWKHIFSPPPPPVPLPHDYLPPDDEEIQNIPEDTAVRRFQAQAYIIHRSRARHLLRKGRRMQRTIDNLLFYEEMSAKRRALERFKKIFWDAMALFNTYMMCRIFPPTRANKLGWLAFDDPSNISVRQRFKIMFSCYSFSRPFGLNLNKRKTGAPAHE